MNESRRSGGGRALRIGRRPLLAALFVAGLARGGAPGAASPAGSNGAPDAGPVGAWHGESTCLVKPSACHDEEALYRFAWSGNARDRVTCSANKIVDGKEILMGDSECTYDAKGHSLSCPLPNGNVVRLEIHGDRMEGGMTLRDGTAWRAIKLRLERPR